jgi:diguanylate cyclase (GGDEF)-like protein
MSRGPTGPGVSPATTRTSAFDASGTLDVRWYAYLGAALTALAGLAALVYLLSTPSGNHRFQLDLMGVGALVLSGMVGFAAHHLIGTDREAAFFYGWSTTTFTLIVIAAILDGAGLSPLGWLLVLPVAYASISYPIVAVRWIAAASQCGVFLLMAIGHAWNGTGWYDFLFVGAFNVLAIASAQNRYSHQTALGRLTVRANQDDLTGCLSHGSFLGRLEVECARARRGQGNFSLVMADVDHFKAINDSYGHQVGDDTLRTVAGALRNSVRATDAVGRLGGDEFGIILIGSEPAHAVEWAGRVRLLLQPPRLERAVLLSMGVAPWTEATDSAFDLMRRADTALYGAKAAGRDRVVLAPSADCPGGSDGVHLR